MASVLKDTYSADAADATAEDSAPTGRSIGRSALEHCAMRYALLAFGWLMVALGVIGILLPGFPGTVFLLIALWAFSKSSERFHSWLYDHRVLGPPIRNWHEHRVIPIYAKTAAVSAMAVSLAGLTFFIAESWVLPASVGACLLPIAAFILTRPSRPAA